MRIMTIVAAGGTLLLIGAPLAAQATVTVAPRAFTLSTGDPDRAALGITTSSGGKRDTLGLLVESVTKDSPADKAGLEEGDRLVSVDGVNLRLAPEDAGENDMDGITQRRLVRQLAKHKAGDDVQLRVYRDGQVRSITVTTVAMRDLNQATSFTRVLSASRDRAVLGLSLGGTGSRRDTAGVLVVGVTDDGPAGEAGIEEGDRIAAINGVDLRVAREDAGDALAASVHMRRFTREMGKVKAGDDVELRVYTAGQTRTVHVKAVKASDLPRSAGAFYFAAPSGVIEGGVRIPMAPLAPLAPDIIREGVRGRIELAPRIRLRTLERLDTLRRDLESLRVRSAAVRRIRAAGA